MGRVINPDSAGKQRAHHLRTVAEILRHLSQKQGLDDEARDMVAALVYCFRDIAEGIDISAAAWEKRDYWKKADELRERWDWAGRMADELTTLIYKDQWYLLPAKVMKLLPHVSDIKITKMVRTSDEWSGAHQRLLNERPPT